MLINNTTYQRETLSERPIRQPLISTNIICFDSSMIGALLLSYKNNFVEYLSSNYFYTIDLDCGKNKRS